MVHPAELRQVREGKESGPDYALWGGGRLMAELGVAEQWRVGLALGLERSEQVTRLMGLGGRERWHESRGEALALVAWSLEGVLQPVVRLEAGVVHSGVRNHFFELWNERVDSGADELKWGLLMGATGGMYWQFLDFWRVEVSAEVAFDGALSVGALMGLAWSFYL